MKKYEIAGKDLNGDWVTIFDNIKTLKQAMAKAKKINSEEWEYIDINLIINDDLVETYDKNGNVI
jgi:hypothetical protein